MFDAGVIAIPGTPCKSVIQVIPNPKAHNQYYICDKSEYAYIISDNGKLIGSHKLTASRKNAGEDVADPLSQDNIATTLSPSGDIIYCAREDNYVYTFDSTTKRQISSFLVRHSFTCLPFDACGLLITSSRYPNPTRLGLPTTAPRIFWLRYLSMGSCGYGRARANLYTKQESEHVPHILYTGYASCLGEPKD